jgi:hypothetical protein
VIGHTSLDVINCEHTTDAVVNLFSILLKDFDNRYVPSEGGKVKYFREDEIGCGNRYVGVHQYFFFASFLDPRVFPLFSEIISDDDFQMLKDARRAVTSSVTIFLNLNFFMS